MAKKLKSLQCCHAIIWHNQITDYSRKKTGDEDMELPEALNKEQVKFLGDVKKKLFGIFMGLVLVFDLGISKGYHTSLHQKFSGVKICFIWNF